MVKFRLNVGQFWPFFGVLYGFVGVPELYILAVSVFLTISLREKLSEVERPRGTACLVYIGTLPVVQAWKM